MMCSRTISEKAGNDPIGVPSPLERLSALYLQSFRDRRRERLFFSSLGFFLAFALARAFAHAVRNEVGPFRNVSTGGTRVHHSYWGIVALLGMGYAWLLEIGTGRTGSRHGMRAMALLYGAGAALTLDEYALWLKLQNDYKIREDDYWQGGGRKSVYAVLLFGSSLLVNSGAYPWLRGLLGDADTDEELVAVAKQFGSHAFLASSSTRRSFSTY